MRPGASPAKLVQCGEHGPRAPAAVCEHLVESLAAGESEPIGFYETEIEESDWPTAVCEDCIARFNASTAEYLNEITEPSMICDACFARLRDTHAAGNTLG